MPKSAEVGLTAAQKKTKAIERWLTIQGIRYTYKRDAWERPEGRHVKQLSWQEVVDLVSTTAPDLLARSPGAVWPVLRQWSRRERDQFVSHLQSTIIEWTAPKAESDALWDTWVHAICGDGAEMTKAVLQHFVWQVLRKLYRQEVTDHMCPIFFGRSGAGKSVEIRKFLAPLDAVVSEQTLDQVCDERHWLELARHYIIYLDELAGARRADRDTLKTLITSPQVTAHVFHSQRREYVVQNATLIGSSNRPVSEVIYDSTSARRYWEVRVRDEMDWDTLATIDRRVLWASIDPLGPSPLDGNRDVKRRIQRLQERHLRARPPIELWAEETGVSRGDIEVDAQRLYESYCLWCGTARVTATSKPAFARQLRGILGLTPRKKHATRVWLVNKKL
jgi:AraC-like DNA-binding protein